MSPAEVLQALGPVIVQLAQAIADLLKGKPAQRVEDVRPDAGAPAIDAALADLIVEAQAKEAAARLPSVNAPRDAYETFVAQTNKPDAPAWDEMPALSQQVWIQVAAAARK